MNSYKRIYTCLVEERQKRRDKWWEKTSNPANPAKAGEIKRDNPSHLVGTSRSCDAKGGCFMVHPGKTHWEHIHGKPEEMKIK